jgi:hypothetical protein
MGGPAVQGKSKPNRNRDDALLDKPSQTPRADYKEDSPVVRARLCISTCKSFYAVTKITPFSLT